MARRFVAKRDSSKRAPKKRRIFHTVERFPDRRGKDWEGPLVDYKEVELLRKFVTTSNKLMSRKRGGTSAREQRALQLAIKRARFIALVPYTSA